jgi:monoamine oxidase
LVARTPLLNWFQQLYRDFEAAEKLGKPIHGIRCDENSGLNRRDFLKGAGAMTAALGFAGSKELWAGQQPRIVIIGAGIAGLHAALTLQDADYASTIYEASSRVVAGCTPTLRHG